MKNKHLSLNDRRSLSVLLRRWFKQYEIAKELDVSPSRISREVRDNSVNWEYDWKKAHDKYKSKRRFSKYQSMKIQENEKLSNYIKKELKRKDMKLSPEVIAYKWNKLEENKSKHITAKSIYKWFDSVWWLGYKKYLLFNKWYKKKPKVKWSRITNRVSIEVRDENITIKDRLAQWHYEADLIVSKKWYKWAVLTLIDRNTRLWKAFKIKNKESSNIMKLIVSVKTKLNIKTVTFDNWLEFAKHEILNNHNIQTYFSDPYSPWQKWSIENYNRIIRRYFPKGTIFDDISEEQIKNVADIINNTPRKILWFISPNQAHFRT